ncbi:uncharacterized [Tachysurus ichikawai]
MEGLELMETDSGRESALVTTGVDDGFRLQNRENRTGGLTRQEDGLKEVWALLALDQQIALQRSPHQGSDVRGRRSRPLSRFVRLLLPIDLSSLLRFPSPLLFHPA